MTLPTTRAGELPAEVEGWTRTTFGDSDEWQDGPLFLSANTERVMLCDSSGDRNREYELPLPVLRALLAQHGLHIVGAEEMRVLELERIRALLEPEEG